MTFEKVRPGEYRAQHTVGFIWVVRDPFGKWYWFRGGYSSYPDWEFGVGPFDTRKAAIRDIIRTYS